VFADRTKLSSKPLLPPLTAGGGPIPFGADRSGRPDRVVHISFRQAGAGSGDSEEDRPAMGFTAENQITVYVHELFHCFQADRLPRRTVGNLRYNADVEFAVWSEVEGQALERAYQEKDPDKGNQLLRDFLAARRLKRATSMTAQQAAQESADEFAEGTATYSQLRTLEILRQGGFTPGIQPDEDTYYHGFREVGPLLAEYTSRLHSAISRTEGVYMKAYHYGCFQAVLADRWFPGWQKLLGERSLSIDRAIEQKLAVPDADWPKLQARLEEAYPLADIRKRAALAIGERDEAYKLITSRSGRVYVVDLKATKQFTGAVVKGPHRRRVGLIELYPNGFDAFRFDQVEMTAVRIPANADQLYFLRVVDTEWQSRDQPYAVTGDRQTDGSWKNAVVTTPLFTLRAPHLHIDQTENLVKLKVLARVR
jgi:hypothetical protein